MLQKHYCLIGREHKKILNARRIIILLFALTSLHTAQSVNNNLYRDSNNQPWQFMNGPYFAVVHLLAIDPQYQEVIYVGAVEPGGGLFKTKIAGLIGNTFSHLNVRTPLLLIPKTRKEYMPVNREVLMADKL